MIDIDDRIGSVELAKHLPEEITHVCRLTFGDAAFLGNGPEGPVPIGIERKKVPDLVSSMETGRLSGHQLVGMRARYELVYLLVEGFWRPNTKTGTLEIMKGGKWREYRAGRRQYNFKAVASYLQSLVMFGGVHIWISQSIYASCQWLQGLYEWWQKPWEAHKSHLRFQIFHEPGTAVPLRKPSLLRRLVKELPDVGWEKSRALEKRFRTLPDLVMANEEDLLQVEGIGKIGARKILREIHGENAPSLFKKPLRRRKGGKSNG